MISPWEVNKTLKTLIHNARILTMNRKFDEYQRGWMLIEGKKITACGAGLYHEDSDDIDDKIDVNGDLIMPGMINTHCHMSMTLFRGLGEDVDNRLFKYILPLEREAVTPNVVRIGAELAALEMIMGGVTTTADMYYFEREVGRVVEASGMRAIVGQTLADFASPDHHSFEEGFALVDELREEFQDSELVTASIAPHAPYSTGPAIMERVARYASDYPDIKVQMHLAEMKSEMEWCANNYNCRPVELADKSGLLSPGAIMAHCLEITPDEIDVLKERGVTVAHNARSNAKAGRGIAPIEDFRRQGIPVGLATDGPMSGNTLDIFAQMAPASMFAKLRGGSRACLPARDVVEMATIEGAKTLGMADDIGSIEVGKRADFVRISLAEPRMQPIYDMYATLVFATVASDVRDVMINGKWIMQNREMQTLDRSKILQDTSQIADEFRLKVE